MTNTKSKTVKKEKKEEVLFTLVHAHNSLGCFNFDYDIPLVLEKDPSNNYDHEAIKVNLEKVGQIGWVANSVNTVVGETFSGGRLYDKIKDRAFAKIKYIVNFDRAICEIVDEAEYEKLKKQKRKFRRTPIEPILDDEGFFEE